MHGDYSKYKKKRPNCTTEEQSSSSLVVFFVVQSHGYWKMHAQSSYYDQSHRCRRATCYQRLAHLAETGKNLQKLLLILVK